jgi:cytosine/adenosine deaminase-related metal-dependent hydrolase
VSLAPRLAIRAGWIIAFDGRGHRLLRDGVVVVEGERIVHVGRTFEGTVDETVEARDRVLTPGLITTHAHIGGSPLDRSFIEDRGRPQFWYSGLFEMLPVRSGAQDEAAGRACVDFSMAELLRGGVTTCMEIGGLGDYVIERAAHYGLRVYMGLTFRSGRWITGDGRRVVWEWDEEAGRQGLRRATAASSAATSRRPRWTPARPSCCGRPSAGPTRPAGRTPCTPRSRWSSSTRCSSATA